MKNRLVRWLLAPALIVAALSGCAGLLDDGDEQQTQAYRNALARWEALNIDDYTYTFSLACECGTARELRDVVVTVENGTVVSRVYKEEPGVTAPETIFGAYDTVEELFDVVASSIAKNADVLNVGYHPTFGVPVLVQVDPSTGVGNDYLIFEVEEFTPATAP
jgi:hypothetical protein